MQPWHDQKKLSEHPDHPWEENARVLWRWVKGNGQLVTWKHATRVSAQDNLHGVQKDHMNCEHVQFCEAFTHLLGHLGLGVMLGNDYSRIESAISKQWEG